MEASELSRALSGIDDDLLHEADHLKVCLKKQNVSLAPISLYRKAGVMAAAACAVLALGIFSFRTVAIRPEITSLKQPAVATYARGITNNLQFEIVPNALLGCKISVEKGTLSMEDAQGEMTADRTTLSVRGDARVIWNITPEDGQEYSLVIKGGIMEKTLVLRFDRAKNEWEISE